MTLVGFDYQQPDYYYGGDVGRVELVDCLDAHDVRWLCRNNLDARGGEVISVCDGADAKLPDHVNFDGLGWQNTLLFQDFPDIVDFE